MPELIAVLAAELERPRPLPSQVIHHLLNTYSVDYAAVGAFLVKELPGLEDFEIDLILSPLFTPSLADQAVVAKLVAEESIPVIQWSLLVQQLVARPTVAQLTTADGQTHAVPLRAVSIERYVHRLRLDGSISPALLSELTQASPLADDRSLLMAIARRAIWTSPPREAILARYLSGSTRHGLYRAEDAAALLKVMETYEPANLAELRRLIPHWLRVLEREITEGGGATPFFNERVADLHGGGRDQRRRDDSRLAAKENERAFLTRLRQVLGE